MNIKNKRVRSNKITRTKWKATMDLQKKENFLETPIYKINELCKKNTRQIYTVYTSIVKIWLKKFVNVNANTIHIA